MRSAVRSAAHQLFAARSGCTPSIALLHSQHIRLAPACELSIRRRDVLRAGIISATPFVQSRPRTAMAASQDKEDQPADFRYTHMWVSADGETHLKECAMKGFEMKKFAETEQWVKPTESPTKAVFSELPVGNFQDWHSCPQTQFVTCLAGSWFVKTTDGTRRDFKAGEVLFQDDTKDSPAAEQPKHQSGVVGDVPNQQLILQIDRKPEVDNPGALSHS